MQEFPLATGHYESRSLPLAAQECVNVVTQFPQTEGALSQGSVFRLPGISAHVTLPEGPGRGGLRESFTEAPYVVSGTGLYRVNEDQSYTKVGTIAGTKRVSMASNGTVIAIIVPGEKGYFCDIAGGTTTEITDPVFLEFMARDNGVGAVGYKAGYFAYTVDTEWFVGSANTATGNYGKNFDALDFDEAWINPDKNVLPFTIKNELYICGTRSFQLFQSITTTGFPFTPIGGTTIDAGLAARFGIVESDGSAMFIGGNPNDGVGIHRLQAGTASKKSTAFVDKILESYTKDEISECFACAWGEYGNRFVSFTLARHTLLFNATASAMTQRLMWTVIETDGSRWRVQDVIRAYNKNYVTDNVDGRVGILTMDAYQEYGVDVPWRMAGMYFHNSGESVSFSSLELIVESGVGAEAGEDGSNPMIKLEISDQGGRDGTWIDMGERAMGEQGVYTKRMIWNRLGITEFSRIYRFSGTAPVKTALLKLLVDAEGGS